MSEAELSDIAPAVLARQRVPQYEGATMSWPHGNSAQGVYYNRDILEQAGFEAPARTWPEFMEQARTIKEVTGLPACLCAARAACSATCCAPTASTSLTPTARSPA